MLVAAEIDICREGVFLFKPLVIFLSLSGLQKEHSFTIKCLFSLDQLNVLVVILNSLQEQMHRSSQRGRKGNQGITSLKPFAFFLPWRGQNKGLSFFFCFVCDSQGSDGSEHRLTSPTTTQNTAYVRNLLGYFNFGQKNNLICQLAETSHQQTILISCLPTTVCPPPAPNPPVQQSDNTLIPRCAQLLFFFLFFFFLSPAWCRSFIHSLTAGMKGGFLGRLGNGIL